VVAARSPRFGDVSLHETQVVDGVSRMREVERLPVAPGAEAVLAPGGLHLMLMQPDAVMAEGEQVPLVLVLADGREVAAELQVRKTAPEPAHAH
jgi:copper(I)-binding protein